MPAPMMATVSNVICSFLPEFGGRDATGSRKGRQYPKVRDHLNRQWCIFRFSFPARPLKNYITTLHLGAAFRLLGSVEGGA